MCDENGAKPMTFDVFTVNYKDIEINIDKVPFIKNEEFGEYTITEQNVHKIERLIDEIKIVMKDIPQINNISVQRKHAQKIAQCEVSPHGVGYHRIVRCIVEAFESYFSKNKGSDEYFTNSIPICIEPDDENKEQICPDFMVVNNPGIVKDDGIHGVPTYVAEVVSDQNREDAYKDRLEFYRNIGVDEYWIVDKGKAIIIKYLKSEEYIPIYYDKPKSVEVSSYLGLIVDVETVMKGYGN